MVIFDGYDSASTKDMTHQRRHKGKKGTKVSFTLDMNLTRSKDLFLAHSTNKQRFIAFLGRQCVNLVVMSIMQRQMQTYSLF